MKSTILIAALAAMPGVALAAEPATNATAASSAAVKRVTPADAARMRHGLLSQIAVYDTAEGAMRDPTPAEIAKLGSGPTSKAPKAFALRGGGIAARTGPSQLTLQQAERGADGKVVVRHEDDVRKEAGHAR